MTLVTKDPRHEVEVLTMRVTSLRLLFVIINVVSSLEETELKGCNLVIPKKVQIREEPQPESGLLLLHVGFKIFRLGDVPDSGGSFGVDVTQVNRNFCGFITNA